MRALTAFLILAFGACACGGAAIAPLSGAPAGDTTVSSEGLRVVMPTAWRVVEPAPDRPVIDPKTLLVVGTDGVRAKRSQCQIAAYRVPARGAVVVVVGWARGEWKGTPGRGPLARLATVSRPAFECFTGRGAVAQVRLRRTAYQINVMVGDRASKRQIGEALAVARSFDVDRGG